jgi:hypothetical protein
MGSWISSADLEKTDSGKSDFFGFDDGVGQLSYCVECDSDDVHFSAQYYTDPRPFVKVNHYLFKQDDKEMSRITIDLHKDRRIIINIRTTKKHLDEWYNRMIYQHYKCHKNLLWRTENNETENSNRFVWYPCDHNRSDNMVLLEALKNNKITIDFITSGSQYNILVPDDSTVKIDLC